MLKKSFSSIQHQPRGQKVRSSSWYSWPSRLRCEAHLMLKGLTAFMQHHGPWSFQFGQWGAGSLSSQQGIPVLRLIGTPEQMGSQQGHLLQREIHYLLQAYVRAFLINEQRFRQARKKAQYLDPYLPACYRRELMALAHTSEVPYPDILLANTFLDIYKLVLCSTLTVQAPATSPGIPLLFGRNLDFPNLGGVDRLSMLVVCHPAQGLPFVAVGWPGMAGVLSGMNQAGLALAVMLVHDGQPYQPGIPMTFLFRQLLEQATNLETALNLLAQSKPTTGCNLMLAQAKQAYLAEISPTFVRIRSPREGVLGATNHYCHHGTPCQPTSMFWLSSALRYRCLMKMLEREHGNITLNQVYRILSQVAMRTLNLQSMVFVPAEKKIHLAIGGLPACDGPFIPLNLEYFWR